ncbi:penicillin-binding protein 1C [Neptuniibacter marinus]|uniref:penicillin-binding protein 1C n=1 Tax=Neptuniibacter marinus TaxID=1806670 RepID=UPI00083321CF|nr:penicillin-binding protein 1C [Neptuniibacter marinus]
MGRFKYALGLLVVVCFVLSGLLLADIFYPLKQPQHDQNFASIVLDRQGEPLRSFADSKGVWRYEVSLADVSPYYLEALIGYEDRYFYSHWGINPFSLVRAGWQYLKEGKIISGGSTLTMQVARILYPHPRTFAGKCQQLLRALQLEWHLSKQEILELYLNYAPFGGTLEGVQAASLQYLHKPASSLRYSEAALLAVLPQAPSRLRPDRHPQRAERARNKVLERMLSQRLWRDAVVTSAKQEHVAVWPLATPVDAPLLSRRLHRQYAAERVISSTVDLSLQQQFADRVKSYVSPLQGELSAAALLVDNRSHQVLAYVGSADFFDNKRAGHVDMTTAVRSPGSTLKPFLFALALDENLIHSESLLADVPRVANNYRPGNFSQGFSGPVSASEALTRSLNLPFVQLIEAYGAQNFVNKLHHVGTELTIPDDDANPAIILGGTGFTLEKLVTIYSALANKGSVYPLRYTPATAEEKSRQLMTPEAAWITWKVLNGVKLPRNLRYGVSRQNLPAIGWKTGTSWNYRDVWAVGVSKEYTLGVWLGRPDGKPMEKTMGSVLAGPLLFSLFNQLNTRGEEIEQPASVSEQKVCWPDGRKETFVDPENCHIKRMAYVINDSTPRTLAFGYQWGEKSPQFFTPELNYLVNHDSLQRVTRECDNDAIAQTAYLWPNALEPWVKPSQRMFYQLPRFDSRCNVIPQESAPLRITGINQGQVYYVLDHQMVTLSAEVEGAAGELYWYLNGKLQDSRSTKLTLQLKTRQQYKLYVQDKTGSNGRVEFEIL